VSALLVCALGAAIHAVDGDITFVSATINGSFALGGRTITSFNVNASPASGGTGSASTSQSPNASSGTYALTVGVPQGASGTAFNVYAQMYSDNSRDYLRFSTQQTIVSPTTPGTADFLLPTPGFISATINVNGGSLASASIYTYYSQGTTYEEASTNGAGPSFEFPIIPRSGIYVSGTVNFTNGTSAALPSQQVTVAPGQTLTLTFNVTAPNPTGSISGSVNFDGAAAANYGYIYASGPSSRSTQFTNNSNFSLSPLIAGQYYVDAYLYLNNTDDYFVFPSSSYSPQRSIAVGNAASVVNVYAQQAFINGTLQLSGSSLLSLLNSGYASFTGSGDAAGGYARDQLNVTTRQFDSIVSAGTWRRDWTSLNFYRPSPYYYENLQIYHYQTAPVTVAAGETVMANQAIAFGEVTVSMSVANGATLSYPSLSGYCYDRDQIGNVKTYSYFSASTQDYNVAQASVSVIGPGGDCWVTPRAYVNGSWVSVNAVPLTIVPGTSQTVDVGGPTLTITAPGANAIMGSSTLVVTGLADDDVAVAGVSVNGTAATLTSTGNPSKPAEKQFSATVTLQKGPNTITTVATDTASPPKSGTDTRTVYFDEAAPTVAFTPADESSTFDTSVTVLGTADDDAGIQTVTVNGVQVNVTSTQNPLKPKEVSFTTDVGLSPGTNPITVVATDISNRVTTVTHAVTRSTQQATVLTALDAAGVYGEPVQLRARLLAGSSDAPVAGKTIEFTAFGNVVSAVTGSNGEASVSVTPGPAGSSTFQAAFTGDTSFGASTDSAIVQISKATATVTISNLTQTYTGSPLSPNATTTPGNLAVTWTGGSQTNAGSYPVTATINDPNYQGSASGSFVISKAAATVVLGNMTQTYTGAALMPTATTTPAGLAFTWSRTPQTNAGSYPVTATIDNPNYQGSASGSFVIAKATPTVSVIGGVYTHDGLPHPATGSVTGIGNVTLGTPVFSYNPAAVPAPVAAGVYTALGVFAGNANYTAHSASGVITINEPPVISLLTGPSVPLAVGSVASLSATITDAATQDKHTCTFVWDDGTSNTTVNKTTVGNGSCAANHTYTTPGVYTVTVTATDDDDLATTQKFQYAVVYDPTAGFVTGGGWINSAAGAYTADQSLVGKANFGFVSKYKRGMTVPTGETEFQFQVANFRFNSTDYEWLVISGAKSQFKGSGMVNGAGNFGFLLTATDGQVTGGGGIDKFRIKIWNTESGATVYDNVPESSEDLNNANPQSLGGGSIVIHAK
jgi:hypothetical protein